ncbi:succinylglutamate desuccinylase [Paraburkholderia hayleyella]|uniref:succinylglutamate desuccinylase n=1 Tax=Paraburkholderia hayleyella TaxID=2152889 RepID=UPI001291FF67|nr:succinylglutamate desuccinylase [Paraburkholderia hayleyella]
MISNASSTEAHGADAQPNVLLDDFLAYTLALQQPAHTGAAAQGSCAQGQLRWVWLDDGVLQLGPVHTTCTTPSVLLSAGIHGDETAPLELLSRLVSDLAAGRATLACRLLVVLGNIGAMRAARRYLDDDLNRLFSGGYAEVPASREASRAAALEEAARQFFTAAQVAHPRGSRWHLDLHTAIRPSVFEQFALLPHTRTPVAPALVAWLGAARIAAVLLHTTKSRTYSHFSAQTCQARACTLELGQVRPFGQNDLTHFAATDTALRDLLAGYSPAAGAEGSPRVPRVFTVIDQITKHSEAFELLVAADVPNFTPFPQGTVLARDGAYRYVVQHEQERLVFPNPGVKPGLRAGLLVIEAPREALFALPGPAVSA